MNTAPPFFTPFCALVHARELAHVCQKETLLAVFASSAAKVFPFQVAAARFALHAPGQKGAVLCDEGSLGKTYEALLIAAQKWLEGYNKILIILPPNLLPQWQQKIEKDFTLPCHVWRSGPLPQEDALILTTYDCAVKNAALLAQTPWDLAVFDEADCLFKPANKSVQTLKAALPHAFKLLLTPTPITLSIMDIYGLIHFIDQSVLPPADEFYKRYFRKPHNYPELAAFVAPFCFRTLKNQVKNYVGFSRRVPVTLDYTLTPAEKTLYALVQTYLKRPAKQAYPEMDPYELNLLFYHTLSSSAGAFSAMLAAPLARTRGAEHQELLALQAAAGAVAVPAKFTALSRVLKAVLKHLRVQKLPQKAVVFVNSTVTLGLLTQHLTKQNFRVLAYKNEKSVDQFRHTSAQVLLTLDAAAKGLDMEFCPVVINYDLLYNAIEMEQRICRCHRQGQQADVLVVNLLSKENLADVRVLELINKRTLQFDGIFGSSDDLVGTFMPDVGPALPQVRPAAQTTAEIAHTLQTHRAENEQIVSRAENILFTTFSKAVADKVILTPKYVQERADELNHRLWELVKYFFAQRADYTVDETNKTLTLTAPQPPVLFYYLSGGRSKPYTGKKQYGLNKDFKPSAHRITFTSLLGKGLLEELECPPEGELTVPQAPQACRVGFFRVRVQRGADTVYEEDVLVGQDQSGRPLPRAACRHVLSLPATEVKTRGPAAPYWLKGLTGGGPDAADLIALIDRQALLQRYTAVCQNQARAEAEALTLAAARKKAELEKSLYNLKIQADELRARRAQSTAAWEELQIQKKLAVTLRDLRAGQEMLPAAKRRIDQQLQMQLKALRKTDDLEVKITPLFAVNIHR